MRRPHSDGLFEINLTECGFSLAILPKMKKIVPEALTDATEGSNLHITRQVSRGQNSKYQVIFDQESHNVLISAKWIILRKTNRRMYGGKRKQKGRNRL